MNELVDIQNRVNDIYNEVFNGNRDVLNKLDNVMLDILKYDDLSLYTDEEISNISIVISKLTEKINLIYDMLEMKKDTLLTIEILREEFKILEMKRFEIVNSYVMGMVTINDINSFRDILFKFRQMLYAIPISDSTLLEIAKMKSKVQHFDTEVLEDEEILRVAYSNSN